MGSWSEPLETGSEQEILAKVYEGGWMRLRDDVDENDWIHADCPDSMIAASGEVQILAHEWVGGAIYVASSDEDPSVVTADVILVGHDTRGATSMKRVSEYAGPTEARCPVHILELLTPIDDGNDCADLAHGWRARCWAHHELG